MKKAIFFMAALVAAVPLMTAVVALPAAAQSKVDLTQDLFESEAGAQGGFDVADTGLGERDPREIIASVINIALGFLGIIAVLLILVGGFRWMTASGNDEQVAGAKNLMIAGVVGLVIVLAAFGIARFVVDALVTATATTPTK